MRATHWLIGCALCLVGIGNAVATNLDTQEQDSTQRSATDSTGSHESNSSGGDLFGLTRDIPTHNTGSDSSGNTSGNNSDHPGGTPSTPTPSRQSHLGWQSLLPGSIQ